MSRTEFCYLCIVQWYFLRSWSLQCLMRKNIKGCEREDHFDLVLQELTFIHYMRFHVTFNHFLMVLRTEDMPFVPMLFIPFYGDQLRNALRGEKDGYGLTLPFSELSAVALRKKMNAILMHTGYKENVTEVSRIFRDNSFR
uniref:CSON003910 protein n=1 Tax=Culicoides sonorensis TaxID=179676 RepID=A0A336M504_CULSO